MNHTAVSDSSPALAVMELGHRYGERQALCDLSFSVSKGEIFGLLGLNGSGKTTTFKILSTLLWPTQGRAEVFGADVCQSPHAVRASMGVLFQTPGLDLMLSVSENLIHHGHLYGLSGKALKERTRESLERMGLSDRAPDRAQTLSGGLKRQVELAKCLLHRPRLLLLDEPSTGLDPTARREFWKELVRLRDELGMTVVLTTHLMDEAQGCDRLAILDRGRRVALDTPQKLQAMVGGDVLSIECDAPEAVAAESRELFSVEAEVVEGRVRIEVPDGHRFVPKLVEHFPKRIRAVAFGKPTLEDAFVHLTGRRFVDKEEDNA